MPQLSYTITNVQLMAQLSDTLKLDMGVVLYEEDKASGHHSAAGATVELMRFVSELRLEGVSYDAIAAIIARRYTDKYLELSSKGELLDESCIKVICSKVREVLTLEDNVKQVRAPVTVVGDVHG